MKKIETASRWLSRVFLSSCLILPAFATYVILCHIDLLAHQSNFYLDPSIKLDHLQHFSLSNRLLLLAIEAIPTSITMLLFYRLYKLFKQFELGVIFTMQNIRLMKSIGLIMIVGELAQLIYQPLMSYCLTMSNPTGRFFISIQLGTTNFKALIMAVMIFVIAWILQEANALKSENQLTI